MPKVIIERPNRTKPRLWTPKDLARIAKYLKEKRGVSIWKIVGYALGAAGGGAVICKTAIAIKNVTDLLNVAKQILAALAVGKLAERVLQWLRFSKALPQLPYVRYLTYFLVALLAAIEAIEGGLKTIIGDLDIVIELGVSIGEACEAAREYGVQVVEDSGVKNAAEQIKESIENVIDGGLS